MRHHLLLPSIILSLCLAVTAHADDSLRSLDAPGLQAELEALKGRVVLINFWATWCRSCLEEIPALMKIDEELHDKGFSLLSVSLDDPDSADALVRPFMEKRFPGFSSYMSIERDMDDMVSVVDPSWNEILPTSYLLARDGSVAERMQGKSTAEAFTEKILTRLNRN